jgi:hypothetical protein
VVGVRVAPKVQRLAVIHRRDHIPRGPPSRDVIERRKLARDVVRLIIRRGARRSEPYS